MKTTGNKGWKIGICVSKKIKNVKKMSKYKIKVKKTKTKHEKRMKKTSKKGWKIYMCQKRQKMSKNVKIYN